MVRWNRELWGKNTVQLNSRTSEYNPNNTNLATTIHDIGCINILQAHATIFLLHSQKQFCKLFRKFFEVLDERNMLWEGILVPNC